MEAQKFFGSNAIFQHVLVLGGFNANDWLIAY
jgi:hypothetical protein